MSQLTVTGIAGLPEIQAGTDIAALICDAVTDLRDGDIVVITSKIIRSRRRSWRASRASSRRRSTPRSR